MTQTATSPTPVIAQRLPWPSLLVLGAATFAMVTAEMLPTAVLEPMSRGLGTTDVRTAQLVSLWAGVVVVASFPLVALTRRFVRRDVIVAGLVALSASAALTALAQTYAAAIGARLLGAAAVGLLWATVNAQVADLVPDRLLGSAVSVVLGGATLGMVIGTPASRLVADVASWRTAFLVLAGLGALMAVLVRMMIPATSGGGDQADETSARSKRPVVPLLVVTGLVALVLVGHYGAYTYVTLLTQAAAYLLPGGVSALLLVFGVSSAVGIAVAGRLPQDWTRWSLVVAVVATAATLGALPVAATHPLPGIGVVVAWGVASGAVPALAQTEILRRGGREHRALTSALIPVLFNGGIGIGAALAALLADRDGIGVLPLPAAAVVLAAAVGLALARA